MKYDELSWSLVVEPTMADHHFDAINYVHQLTAAGVPLAQAEAHANALADVLADVLEILLPLVTDVATLKQSVADLKDRIDEMDRRIDRLETRMNWTIGLLVATQLTLFGMIGGLYLAH